MSHLFPIILAGGAGTRLWPRSRRQHPKQLLDLLSPRTMLQETFDRVTPLAPPEQTYVITNVKYVDQVCSQLPEIPPENVVGEPEGRGTAPPVGLAALTALEHDPHAVLLCLPADHSIPRVNEFREMLLAASEIAQQQHLVTLGIQPNYAETGYGYIEAGEALEAARGARAFRVRRFTEKPDELTAKQFVEAGNYYWNSGMFIWRADVILQEFERYMPRHLALLRQIVDARGPVDSMAVFDHAWREMENETIDFGIMEKSQRVAVLPLDVGWSDVGSWASLLDLLDRDSNQNAILGDHLVMQTKGSLIYGRDRLIAAVGLENMIVVDTGDAILICPKDQSQQVKQIVDELKRREQDQYL